MADADHRPLRRTLLGSPGPEDPAYIPEDPAYIPEDPATSRVRRTRPTSVYAAWRARFFVAVFLAAARPGFSARGARPPAAWPRLLRSRSIRSTTSA